MSLGIGSKYYKTGFTYPQYLKIILMLYPKSLILSRFNTVIEDRFGCDTSDLFTEVSLRKKMVFKGKLIPFKFEKIIEGTLSYE